jgi:hypothetical protein
MFLKAVDIPLRRIENAVFDRQRAQARHVPDDPYLDLAVALLAKRGPLTDADAAELSARVRRHRALAAWRGLAA